MDIFALHDFLANQSFTLGGLAIPNYLPPILVTLAILLAAKRPATAVYIGLIPLINWSFAHVPTVPIAEGLGGGVFQPLAVVTGLVLVVRDFAQRELGHWVFGAMVVGLAFSAVTTPLAIVVASGAAFLISEVADWAVFTFTKRPLSQRVLLSSAIGAPLDSAIFLYGANMVTPGVFAWGTAITSIVSKLAGALVVAAVIAARERQATST
jgi:queuosine precursor transporter